MSLLANLCPRLRLLRAALFRRYIWADLTEMVQAHGQQLREIRADLHPLRFADSLPPPSAPALDFATLGPASAFAPADFPAWNSEPSVGSFLGQLASRLRARHVVELGSFVGWTSAHLALGLRGNAPEARLWCVEFQERYIEVARANLRRHGLEDRVSFLRGLSLDPAILAALPPAIDLLFLDTSHEYEDTLREIDLYAPRLAPGGLLVLHDAISQHGVRLALAERLDRFDVLTFATEFGNGLAVLRPRTA